MESVIRDICTYILDNIYDEITINELEKNFYYNKFDKKESIKFPGSFYYIYMQPCPEIENHILFGFRPHSLVLFNGHIIPTVIRNKFGS